MYYAIWVDCLVRLKSQPANQHRWKGIAMTLMSLAMFLNFWLVVNFIELAIFKRPVYRIHLEFMTGNSKKITEFLMQFVLPVLIMNYMLIFRNNRYEKLIEKYPYRDGRLFLTYFLVSMATPIIVLWLIVIFNQLR